MTHTPTYHPNSTTLLYDRMAQLIRAVVPPAIVVTSAVTLIIMVASCAP